MVPVKISEKAAEEIKSIMDTKNIPDGYGLRVGVRGGGGCSAAGMGYMLGFDKQKENDKAYQLNDIDVFIDKSHVMYIIGMEVDFYEGNDARGFMFVNPETKEEQKL